MKAILLHNTSSPPTAGTRGKVSQACGLRKQTGSAVSHLHRVNIALRNFTPTDLPQLEDWVLRGDLAHFMSRWTPRSFRNGQWDRQLAHWWIIVADDSDVGTLWIERTAVGDTVADLGILIGIPEMRGGGTGQSAIRLAETEVAAIWGITTMRLRVRQNNKRAIRCYTNAGYIISAVFEKIVAEGERIAAMEMTRQLIKP